MTSNNNNKQHATLFTLPYVSSIFDSAVKAYESGDRRAFLRKDILDHIMSQVGSKLERGDIVDVPRGENEQTIRWIWNGLSLIAYTSDHDEDCDMLPAEFKVVTEFPIHYWDTLELGGTCYGLDDVHFDYTSFLDELCFNLTYKINIDGESSFSTFFKHSGRLYLVEFDKSVKHDEMEEVENMLFIQDALRGKNEWTPSFNSKPLLGYDGTSTMHMMVSDNTLFCHFCK